MGIHVSTGTRPEFIEQCSMKGHNVDLSIFNKEHKHTYINHEATAMANRMEKNTPVKTRLMQTNSLAQRLRK